MEYPTSDFQEEYINGDASDWVDGDDDEWEDGQYVRQDPRMSSRAGSWRQSARQRRPAKGPRRRAREIPYLKPEKQPLLVTDVVADGLLHGAVYSFHYTISILSPAIRLLRYPLSAVLCVWLLGFIISHAAHTLRFAFAPLCTVPGISRSSICRWDPQASQPTVQWADYPRLSETQSKMFDQLLDDSVGNTALSLEIKKTEIATKDLVTLVRLSDLKAKDSLERTLTEFIEDAKKTGRGLYKLASKVGGAMDSIMAVNDYALQSIESARKEELSAWSLSSLAPWRARSKSTNTVVRETFQEAMDTMSSNLERIIVEAEANHQNLENLGGHLAVMLEPLSREERDVSLDKSKVLTYLWTRLGGNGDQLRNFERNLAFLRDLTSYREEALAHVVGALHTLKVMSEDMEDMRDRVAAPELTGSSVPVEVHMRSIAAGLARLQKGRMRAQRMDDDALKRAKDSKWTRG